MYLGDLRPEQCALVVVGGDELLHRSLQWGNQKGSEDVPEVQDGGTALGQAVGGLSQFPEDSAITEPVAHIAAESAEGQHDFICHLKGGERQPIVAASRSIWPR